MSDTLSVNFYKSYLPQLNGYGIIKNLVLTHLAQH